MITCTHCSKPHYEGSLYCDSCGNIILPQCAQSDTHTTRSHNITLVMSVHEMNKPVMIRTGKEVVIGRHDSRGDAFPDLDLSPYSAREQGVSRIHAAIRQQDNAYTLVDLGSMNGTRINGKRLVPNQMGALHRGDMVQFGNLSARVYW